MLALDEDFHVHSTFSDGAEHAGGERAGRTGARRCARCAWSTTSGGTPTWLPEFAAAVAPFRDQQGPRVLAGVEAKILDTSGRLDLPPGLDGIDLVLIADHQFPGDGGPVHPAQARAAIGSRRDDRGRGDGAAVRGDRERADAPPTAGACSPTCSACCPRWGSTRPWCPSRCSAELAKRVARAGAMVEINEKWACPSPRTVAAMARAGVPVVAGSDSHHCRDVGVYRSVRLTAGAGVQA